jgi:hypothetical protein
MASRFLIAVGGSGQHVALAVTRLVYLGALESNIQLIAIDPDNKEPLSQTLLSPAGMGGKRPDGSSRHPLKTGQVHAPFDLSKYGDKTFAQIFVDADNPDERELFEAMFEADMDTIPVHKGMYGTPCVGATVFAEGAQSPSFSNNLADVGNATEVFVAGSVVGGTGAGITHKLIKEVRTRYPDSKPMYGIFMLPWFKVQSTGEAKGAITNEIIQRNAKHGIKYFFEHTIPTLTSSALIGFPEGAKSQLLNQKSVGTGDMGQERPDFLHLVSAHALARLNKGHTANRDVRAYYVSHPTHEEDWLLADIWEDGKGLVAAGAAHRDDAPHKGFTLRQRIRAHQVLLNLLTFLTNDKQVNELLSYYKRGLLNFAPRSSWGDDLHKSITNAVPDDGQQLTFVEGMLQEFRQIRQEVAFCVDWAQELFTLQMLRLPEGDPLLDGLLSGTAKQWEILRNMWEGRAIPGSATEKVTAAKIARSHAKFILDAALKV